MAKVKTNWYVESMRGKVAECGKEFKGHGIRMNADGSLSSFNISERNLTLKPYSAAELAVRAKFKAAVVAVQQVMSNPDQLAQYVVQFRQQTKYRTLRGFVFAKKFAEVSA